MIKELQHYCQDQESWLLATIGALVRMESPTDDKRAVDRCGLELARREGVAKAFVHAFMDGRDTPPRSGLGYMADLEKRMPFRRILKTTIDRAQKAGALGVKVICVHKGLPFGRQSYEHSQCSDIGVVAKRFPDVNFLIYHSGFVTSVTEGPYQAGRDGIDTLIQSLQANGIAHGSNVHAELGSTWRFLMRDPSQAAHAMGKLLKHLGPDNILWGTDSIWYGSPQDQITAFRTFQITKDFRDKYAYPEITPALRAKIFGLNAAKVYGISADEVKKVISRDRISAEKMAYSERPDPHFLTYGPKTRREFLALGG